MSKTYNPGVQNVPFRTVLRGLHPLPDRTDSGDAVVSTSKKGNPWQVISAAPAENKPGIHITLFNHYCNQTRYWTINWSSFRCMRFVAKRYDFTGTTWAPGSRERLAGCIRAARRVTS